MKRKAKRKHLTDKEKEWLVLGSAVVFGSFLQTYLMQRDKCIHEEVCKHYEKKE